MPITESRLPVTSPLAGLREFVCRRMLQASLLIFGIPFIALCFYAAPAADDFCKATLAFDTVPQHSVLAVTWLYYTRWTPRWATTLIQSVMMSSVNLGSAYGWLLLLTVAVNVLSLWYFFAAVFKLSRSNAFLAGAAFYAAWLASIGNPDEQVYWLTGSTEYSLSLSALLLLGGLLCRPRKKLWYHLVIAALAFAIPGLHEIAGVFLCVVLLLGSVVMHLRKAPARQWHLSLAMALASQAAVVFSPGTSARAAAEHKQLWDIAHTFRWFGHSFYTGLDWLAAPAILVAACVVAMLSEGRGAQPVDDARRKPLAASGLVMMLGLLCLSAFVETATSTWLPPRVVSWFQFVFWLLFVGVVVDGVPEISRQQLSAATKIGVFTLFAAILLVSSNYRKALQDIRGPAEAWHRVSQARLTARGDALEFTAPAQFPAMAKPQMLIEDSSCWVNRCLANYLNAKSVTVKNSADFCPH